MRTVTASEANQQFSKLMAEAERGEDVIITRRGKPAVRLSAVKATPSLEERREALRRLSERSRVRGVVTVPGWTRESLYDRTLDVDAE